MAGATKLMTAGGGGVILTPASSIASDVTVNVPSVDGTLVNTGSTGQVSQSMLAANVAGNGPAFAYYQSVTQNIATGTATKLTFTSSVFDTTGGMYASSKFTPTVAGYYQITASVSWGASTANTNQILYIYKNGSSFYAIYGGGNTAAGAGCNLANLVYLNGSTDYVEIYVIQQSGSTVSTFAGTRSTSFSAVLMRAA